MRKTIRHFVVVAALVATLSLGTSATVRADYYIPPTITDYQIIDLEFGGWIIEVTYYSNGTMKMVLTQLP